MLFLLFLHAIKTPAFMKGDGGMYLKTDVYRACQEYDSIGKLRASVKHSHRYDDLDYEDRAEIIKALDKLSSYIFDKIES